MSVDHDISQIYIRQEAHIALTDALVDRVESLSEQVEKLMEWANQPADRSLQDAMAGLTEAMRALAPPESKDDLPELIRYMTAALRSLQTQVVQHGSILRDLPSAVAQAVGR